MFYQYVGLKLLRSHIKQWPIDIMASSKSEKILKFEDLETHLIDGIIMIKAVNPVYHIRRLQQMQCAAEDVFVCGFPKSGNVWMLTTVYAIMAADDLDRFEKEGTRASRKSLEDVYGWEENAKEPHPAVYFTHMKYDLLPEVIKQGKNKVIHIRRNPKDVSVSMFHYIKMSKAFDEQYTDSRTWEDVFHNIFLSTSVPLFGDYFGYHEAWMKHQDKHNILYVTYEDFIRSPETMVANVAAFLGREVSKDQISRITKIVSFDSMRNNPKLDIIQPDLLDQRKGRFIRKGCIGDWKNYYTDEQSKKVDELSEEFAQKTGVSMK